MTSAHTDREERARGQMDRLISLQAAIDLIRSMESDATSHGISPRLTPNHVINGIESLPSADRLIKEAVSTLIHTKGDDAVSVAFRNAGRFVQNAIDGEPPEFEKIPSADRPTGKWVFDTQIPISGGGSSAGYRCSICGRGYFRVDGVNFCPNCGSYNGGEQQEGDNK